MLTHRENTIMDNDGGTLDPGASYTVTVYPVGAIASGAQSGGNVAVYAPHSFRSGDKVLINPQTSGGTFVAEALSAATATQLTWASATPTISAGDVLVNLGPDGATGATPQLDDSPVRIYSVPDGSSAIADSSLTCDANGKYEYWYRGSGQVWELVQDSAGNIVDIIKGFGQQMNVFNVEDFGANSNQADASARLQAAFDAHASLAVGECILPDIYTTTAVVKWKVDGCTLKGFARRGTKSGLKIGHTGVGLHVETRQGKLLDFEVNGQSNAGGSPGIQISSFQDSVAMGVHVIDVLGNGWTVDKDTADQAQPQNVNCRFIDCLGINAGAEGFEISENSTQTNIELWMCKLKDNTNNGLLLRADHSKVMSGLYENNGQYGISIGDVAAADTVSSQEGCIFFPHLDDENTLGTWNESKNTHKAWWIAARNIYFTDAKRLLGCDNGYFYVGQSGASTNYDSENHIGRGPFIGTAGVSNGILGVRFDRGSYVSANSKVADTDFDLSPSGVGSVRVQDRIKYQDIETLEDSATPNVNTATIYQTGTARGSTSITNMTNGVAGQIVTIIAEEAFTVTDNANLVINGGNYVMAANDTISFIYDGSAWLEIGRGANSI